MAYQRMNRQYPVPISLRSEDDLRKDIKLVSLEIAEAEKNVIVLSQSGLHDAEDRRQKACDNLSVLKSRKRSLEYFLFKAVNKRRNPQVIYGEVDNTGLDCAFPRRNDAGFTFKTDHYL